MSRRRARSEEPPRFLLYSHDSYGLGHLRRSLMVAQRLAGVAEGASALVVSGSPCATFFPLPPGVEVVKLPSVSKDAEGAYVPRTLGGSLAALLVLRRRILLESFRAFAPDVVLVDHQVTGLHGEALPLLREARRDGVRTVLGVRDVIDAPEVVAREWGTPEYRWALGEAYDRVVVYGVPEVFDARVEYPLPPELRARLEFAGYVARPRRPSPLAPFPRTRPHVVATAGGGEDGGERLELLLAAMELDRPSWEATVVAGPLLGTEAWRRVKRRARSLGLRVHRSHGNVPALLADADAVVAMAGYNTCVEILQAGRRAVFLPRTQPRLEQAIRAERLERLGLAASLPFATPAELRAAVERALREPLDAERVPDLSGAERTAAICAGLAGVAEPSAADSSGTRRHVAS